MRCIFVSEFKVIDIIDNAVLKNIKARLWSGDRLVILEFVNKEDESRKGSGIDGENDSENEDN